MKRTKFLSRAWTDQHLNIHNQYQGRRVRDGVSHDSDWSLLEPSNRVAKVVCFGELAAPQPPDKES